MDHRRAVTRVCLTGLGLGLILAGGPVAQVGAAPQEKVTICHGTNSIMNPYVQQTVNESSIVMPNGSPTGHGLHTGPAYPQPNWGDVIPPFTYNNDRGGTSIYHGLNWASDGQAIWNGGCEVDLTEPPEETTTTTTTTTLPMPTTTSAPTTTTTRPGSTTTRPGSTTTRPGGGTTTTTTTEPPPGTTPTTAPPSERPPPVTDPGGGVEITPAVEAVVVDPGNITVDLGQLSAEQRVVLETEVDSLARTGQNETAMTLGAIVLILLGSFLVFGSRRFGRGGPRHRVRQHGAPPP